MTLFVRFTGLTLTLDMLLTVLYFMYLYRIKAKLFPMCGENGIIRFTRVMSTVRTAEYAHGELILDSKYREKARGKKRKPRRQKPKTLHSVVCVPGILKEFTSHFFSRLYENPRILLMG